MKIIDIIFALISGRIIGFVVGDILKGLGISVGLYESLALWVLLPIITLMCLWIARIIGKKVLIVFQSAKFVLVGAVATVFDLKFFELLIWSASFFITLNPLIAKSISFLCSTALKYWGNKYWTFGKYEKENLKKEVLQFFAITVVGLIIDVVAFYYATNILGPQFSIPQAVWIKLSVIFAAIIAALWNFLGYKFFVFRK